MRDRRTLLNKENMKTELQEECRFILWDNMMESEIRIGRTLFEVSSRFKNDDAQFKDAIGKITARRIRLIARQAG